MKLHVDDQSIRLNPFVHRIVSNIIEGLIESLDDIPTDPERIVFVVDKKSRALIKVNGQKIRMNAFVQKIVGNVLHGIVSSLDDIPIPFGTIKICI